MVRFLRGKNSFLLSSNVNEVIRAVSDLFYRKISHTQKSTTKHKTHKKHKNAQKQTKIKGSVFTCLKNIKGEKSHLFPYLRSVHFALLLSCVFVFFVLFVHVKYFCKKKKGLKLPWWPHLNYYWLKHVRMLKTIKCTIFLPMSWGHWQISISINYANVLCYLPKKIVAKTLVNLNISFSTYWCEWFLMH